ncbi:hypothetical protein ACOMHN_021934 [Nucella lapillus]
MSPDQTCASGDLNLKASYLKLQRLLAKEKFLRTSIQKNLVPQGLSLHFTLAHKAQDDDLHDTIQSVLNCASSRILDAIHRDTCSQVESASVIFNSNRHILEENRGKNLADYEVGRILF